MSVVVNTGKKFVFFLVWDNFVYCLIHFNFLSRFDLLSFWRQKDSAKTAGGLALLACAYHLTSSEELASPGPRNAVLILNDLLSKM
jgi:hypothetical protein